MEIHLRTLVFVVMSLLGSLSLPLVAGFLPQAEPPSIVTSLPTPTPVPLHGLSATALSLAAALETPGPSPVPVTVSAVVATQGANLNLRAGPGLSYPILGSAALGQSLTVTGVSADGEWLRVEISDGSAWVYAPLVTMTEDAELPVVEGDRSH
jgi:uncharacterized protein YraI